MKYLSRQAAGTACMILILFYYVFGKIIPTRFRDIPGKLYQYAETGEWK